MIGAADGGSARPSSGDADETRLSGLRRAGAADVSDLTELQRAAYARNRAILGCEPLPLLVDYDDIVATKETWLSEDAEGATGLLVLEPRPDELHVWNVSVAPRAQGTGLGNRLLAAAEDRARALGLFRLSLITGALLTRNVAWYERRGYLVERHEKLPDRTIVHMFKSLTTENDGVG